MSAINKSVKGSTKLPSKKPATATRGKGTSLPARATPSSSRRRSLPTPLSSAAPKLPSVRRLGNQASRSGLAVTQVHDPAAVVATGYDYGHHPDAIKLTGDFTRGMRVELKQFIGDAKNYISSYAYTNPCVEMLRSKNGTSIEYGPTSAIALNPYRSAFWNRRADGTFDYGVCFTPSGLYAEIARSFTKYRVVSDIRVIYAPGINSDTDLEIQMGWLADSGDPSYGNANNSQAMLSSLTQMTTPSVLRFPAWKLAIMDCPVDPEWKYVYAPPKYGDAQINLSGQPLAADVRSASFGQLSTLSIRPDPAATYTHGSWHVEYVVEFMNPAPVVGGLYKAVTLSSLKDYPHLIDSQTDSLLYAETPESKEEKSYERVSTEPPDPLSHIPSSIASPLRSPPTPYASSAATTPGGPRRAT